MKLKTHLRESSLELLQQIARFWDLEPSDPNTLQDVEALSDYLYPRMQTPTNFRPVFEKLSAAERQWIYFLTLHGGELPVDEMRKRCGFKEAAQLTEATGRLVDCGFLWREKVRDTLINVELIGIAEPFVRLIELPPYWQGFLGFYLQEMGIDELRAIIRHALGDKPATRKKQALVHYLRRSLMEPAKLQEVLGRLEPLQKEMFDFIMHRGGVCAWKDLLDSGVHKKFDHVRADGLRELVELSGLVFIFQKHENKYNNLIMIPRDLAFVIHNNYKKDQRSLDELSHVGGEGRRTAEPASHPGVILDNYNNILRDLVILSAYIARFPVKRLNNGGLSRNDLKKIVPMLSYNKTVKYVSFLALFAIVRKLIIPVGDQWRVSGGLPQWLAKGQACYADLYEFWLGSNEWNEEYIDGDVVHADNYPQNLISITELRKLVLRTMEKLPPDAWVEFETFAESLLPQIPLQVPGRTDYLANEKFNRHNILVMESVIAETLHWMGVVMLGVADLEVARNLGNRPNEAVAPYDPSRPIAAHLIGGKDFLFCFRLTDFGRYLLTRPYLEVDKLFNGQVDPMMPYAGQSQEFTVQPNLEIITPPDLSLDRFFRLLQVADIRKMDIMTTLAITRDSVQAGLNMGLTAEQIIEELAAGSRRELPETVRQMIGECQSHHGDVDMGVAGGYLKVGDPIQMEEIRNNPKIQPSIKDVFDNKMILLNRTTDFKKLARELQKIGYMPRIDSDSLYETSDGLFQITLRSEELYDLLAIIRFGIMIEEEAGAPIFEERVRPLFQRLSTNAQERFNPKLYAESIAKAFLSNFEKHMKRQVDQATSKFRKQVNRLMTQGPRRKAQSGFKGQNPASEAADIKNLIKYAIEQETPIKILYEKNSGEKVRQEIEPEALQGKKLYALNTEDDEHRVYMLDRISRAAM